MRSSKSLVTVVVQLLQYPSLRTFKHKTDLFIALYSMEIPPYAGIYWGRRYFLEVSALSYVTQQIYLVSCRVLLITIMWFVNGSCATNQSNLFSQIKRIHFWIVLSIHIRMYIDTIYWVNDLEFYLVLFEYFHTHVFQTFFCYFLNAFSC